MRAPNFLYGTAWKEQDTRRLTEMALKAGFTGIDTANQRKHYFEAAVGEAIKGIKRDTLFLQTKFTFLDGQDHRLPFDPKATVAEQVRQSFASSLEHLGTDYIDSYVLHGPSRRSGLIQADWDAWRAMEALPAKSLGVSNISLAQLTELYGQATKKPVFVQNRCYARTGWDRDVRAFCNDNGVRYQGFSLLTANPEVFPAAKAIAKRLNATEEQVIFRFCLDAGMIVITGTTDATHMQQDLAAETLKLSPMDREALAG